MTPWKGKPISSGADDPPLSPDLVRVKASGLNASSRAREHTFGQKATILLAAILSWSTDAIGLSIVTYLGNPIMSQYHIGTAALGLVFSSQYVSAVFGAILFGEIADRFGRKNALIVSLLWFSAFMAVSGYAPDFASFTILRVVGGLGNSWGIAFSLLSEGYSPRHRGFFGGILQSTFVLGYVVSALSVATLYASVGWRPLLLLTLVPIPFIAILVVFMPESNVWREYRALQKSRGVTDRMSRTRELLRGEYLRLTIIATFAFFTAELAYHSLVDWMPTLLEDLFNFTVSHASTTIVPISLTLLVVLPFFGYLSDRVGRRPIFSLSAAIGALGTVLLAYSSIATFNVNMSILSLYIIPMGFGSHALFGIWTGEMFPTRIRATATSFIFATARALAVGGLLVGVLAPYTGLATAMVGLGLSSFVLMVLLPRFLPETKGRVIDARDEAQADRPKAPYDSTAS